MHRVASLFSEKIDNKHILGYAEVRQIAPQFQEVTMFFCFFLLFFFCFLQLVA